METQMRESKDPMRLAREIFLDDLDMPVSSAIQIIGEQTGVYFPVAEMTRIKSDVERLVARALPEREATPVNPSYFTNRPRLIIGKQKEPASENDMAKKGRALVDTEEKRAFLKKWAEDKAGMATIKEAKEALNDKFGEALGTSYIANTLKETRQGILDERRKQVLGETAAVLAAHPIAAAETELTAMESAVKSIANLMRVSRIKSIRIEENGEIKFEAATTI